MPLQETPTASIDPEHLTSPGTAFGFSDKELDRIVSLKNLRLAGAVAWTGHALDDSPLVLRDVGSHEIYALDRDAP